MLRGVSIAIDRVEFITTVLGKYTSYENEIKSSEGFAGHVKSKKKLIFLPSLLSIYASVNIKLNTLPFHSHS